MNPKIKKIQNQKTPITCLTAYSYPIAKILDQYCDMILVGDSLGMAIYGMRDTLGVSIEMMINHGQAVTRAAKKALVVVDIPFGSFEKSPKQALETAKKIIAATKCDAVKIETSQETIKTVKYLVENKIPVMGHVGLLPQRIKEMGGYKYQGKDENSAKEIIQTAIDLEKAGAFAFVIEGVPAKLATEISKSVKIPTIGIGASADCGGQVLVIDDLLGLNQEFKPRFVKNYADLADKVGKAVKKFCDEVKSKKFPSKKEMI
ncbi:MAG: panB [Rickettsiaceae bacterium]|jgi:3-methyl-2-oxobutanoate hydroxymethyltransferase|nr:panB [Rickettsiaceae bacterium]